MEADDRVFLLGEDVGAAGGVFKVTDGLMDRFGPRRVLDTPISEQAIIGTAIGAAARGLSPRLCSPTSPRRLAGGAGGGFGAQHSQAVENWFLSAVGLKIVVPATPADAYGLLRASIEDPDPVLFIEHKSLLNSTGDPPAEWSSTPIGRAAVARGGEDLTLVATQVMLHRALEAAESLQSTGISVEVIDPRTLVPFDYEPVRASVKRTNRLVVAQEGSTAGSWGASLIATFAQKDFELLDSPPYLVAAPDTPIPYARSLEEAWIPSVRQLESAVRAAVGF